MIGGTELLARLTAGRSGDGVGGAPAVDGGTDAGPITHVEHLPARPGRPTDWPSWTPSLLRERWATRGVGQPWIHQAATADLVHAGRSVVVATGTASGKSLAYQLPALTALLADDHARVLYVSPTKALAGDQLRSLRELDVPGVRPATYDGDTPSDERDWVRAHANWMLTNPDMLAYGMLPQHARWSSFLRRLRVVVIDECHTYRGVFGAHVALVFRRLQRICAYYGSEPVFVLASATAADPGATAAALTGLDVVAVTEDGSPRAARTFALWEPAVLPGIAGEHGAPVRRSASSDAARLLADLVIEGARTLAFVRSRHGAESTALAARRHVAQALTLAEIDGDGDGDADPGRTGAPGRQIAAYRAGLLAEDRRELERRLAAGELTGVATTSALELGLDISGLDAVVVAGFPGTLASLWQQAGRAGRAEKDALVVFVARDDPLDTYLVHHPEAVFGRPLEATVFDPANPTVLAPHLACAAHELPLTEADLARFGGPAARAVLDELVAQGVLRRRPRGWFWTAAGRPRVDLRGTGGRQIAIVDRTTGRLLGTTDPAAAHAALHDQAVYLHQGESYLVDRLDLDDAVALVTAADPDWTTHAREVADIAIIDTARRRHFGPVEVGFGTVEVTNQVVSFQRRAIPSRAILDETPLHLPPQVLRTQAVWYVVEDSALAGAGVAPADIPGAAHAAEHAAIGMLPLLATCDRWDIGGVSTARHSDTGRATVFVYDGHPGGAGFAARGFEAFEPWLRTTRDAVAGCRCEHGCPSCVQSPKCGNGNEPLDKPGAIVLLDLVIAATAWQERCAG